MKLYIFLTLYCILSKVSSQNTYPEQSRSYVLNPDQIYFEDNTPLLRSNINSNQVNTVNRPSSSLLPPNKENGVVDVNSENSAEGTFGASPGLSLDPSALALTNFSINLMKNINALSPRSTVVSPYSIATLLSLLQQGSTGLTLEQITAALQMAPETSAEVHRKYGNDLLKRNSRNILKVANNIFIADAFSINPEFNRNARQNFASELTPTLFANPVQAARNINSWVASKTNNKINELVSPDHFDYNTQLVLVNAVYFRGLWDIPFRVEATKLKPFQLNKGETKMTQFMTARHYYKYGVDPMTSSKVILLPFENQQYSLMVILPSELIPLSEIISSLTLSQLISYQSFSAKDVDLELPKFTVRADTDLATVLKKMGITQMFTQNSDLTRVGSYRSFPPLVSSAVHSAVLSIDEKGGTAAAATAFAVVALSYDAPSVFLKVNRPFLAVLWDNSTQLPLFMAKIDEPIF